MRGAKTTLALAISLVSIPALAEEQRIEGEVVVTAGRTERPLSSVPNTVTLIDQEALAEQIGVSSDLSTILGNLVPSFSPSRQKLTNSGESLRGRKPLYMIDGVPQSNPLRNGGRDGHTIDPLMLERVEVIHGANAIHGMGASGGIINLVTRKPSSELQQSLRVESSFQPQDTGESLGYGGSYSLSGEFGGIDLLGSVSYRKSGLGYDADGEVIGFDNTQGDTMDSEALNTFIKLGHSWDEQRLELTVNRYEIDGSNDWVAVSGNRTENVPASAEEGRVPGDAPSNEVTTVNLLYSHEAFFNQKLRMQAFSQDFAGTYGGGNFPTFQDPAYGEDIFDQSQNNSEKRGVKITLIKDELAGAPVNLAYGLDILEDKTWQQLIQTDRAWVPPTRYENVTPYAQVEFTGFEQWVVTAGLRREISKLKVDDFTTLFSNEGGQFVEGGNPEFSETLRNIGATWQINDAWRVFANYAEGYSMPDVGRVLRGIDVPDQSVESFLDLKPILTENREIGIDFGGEKLAAQLAYYRSDSDFGQLLNPGSDGIYTVEREKTEIRGLEFRGQWFASDSDTLELRYAQSEGHRDSNANGRVDTDLNGANIAPDRVNLSWARSWSEHLNTRLQANLLLDREFENRTGEAVAEFNGYTSIDLSASLKALDGDFTLGLQNLTNEDYFTYHAQTVGRDNTYFKGLGRSVNLSYSRLF